jgi:hypothetical protein
MDKEEIIHALEEGREEFLDSIKGLSDEEMVEESVFDDWTVKDILAHLTMWEAELVKLLWQARQGQKPTSVHFSKATMDEQNAKWHRQNRERPLERVLDDFHGARLQTVRRVEALSDRDLTDPERYPWLEGTPLWKWIASDSFEHEAEHLAQLREWRQ